MTNQCEHDEKDCQNFQAVEDEAGFPDLSGLEKTTVGKLENGESAYTKITRAKRDGDDARSVGVIAEGRSAKLYRMCDIICYRIPLARIRADEVPIGRAFNYDGQRWTRVPGTQFDHPWFVANICDEQNVKSTHFSPEYPVTLLPE